MMGSYLCYFELHVGPRTFYIHAIVDATDRDAAIAKMKERDHEGPNYRLQGKGCLGEFTEELARKYMREMPTVWSEDDDPFEKKADDERKDDDDSE